MSFLWTNSLKRNNLGSQKNVKKNSNQPRDRDLWSKIFQKLQLTVTRGKKITTNLQLQSIAYWDLCSAKWQFIKLHASKRMGAKSVKLSRRLHFCLFRVIVIFTPNKSNDYKKHSVFRFQSNIAVTKANSQKQENKAITNYGEKKWEGDERLSLYITIIIIFFLF